MHDVLANFISNAIKFSVPGDEIHLSARAEGESCIVEIRDQGIGIEQDKLVHIFDPTISTTTRGTQNEKGTGFGMPLAKSFVEEFNGTLEVHSTSKGVDPDKHGTSIILKLQLALKRKRKS